jgi:coproporphyrinogen III oxidase-like Fe-S oxidoreductase
MMSLRLSEGCDISRISALSPSLLSEVGFKSLAATGLITRTDEILQTTPAGRLVLNQLFLELTKD